MGQTTQVVEKTVVRGPPPMRQDEYQLLNAGPRYWEETHLLPPVSDGEIAQIPPPKDTHFHINDDPSLGGETWRVPVPRAPFSDFNKACRATPGSDDFTRVVPWDHKKKDYCYGAIHDHVFRGRYDRSRLKRKLDHVKQHGSWDPTGSYNKCFICCLVAGALFLIAWILTFVYKPYRWWSLLSTSWIWFLFPIFILMICCTWCCICKASANHATRNRYRYIKHALDDVNDRHLKGSGVHLRPGTKAAWLEVDMDPDRTEIVGDVVDDFRLYNGEEHVKMVEEEVERREDMDARAQIPIENRPKADPNMYVEEMVDDTNIHEEEFIEETTLVGPSGPGQPMVMTETVVPANNRTSYVEERVVSNPSVMSNTQTYRTGGNGNSQMSFYDRLRASKMGNSEMLASPEKEVTQVIKPKGMTPYQKMKQEKLAARRNDISQNATYQSEKPQPL
jgi:hypothetical protein